MRNLLISSDVLTKLREKHQVEAREVEQCFENRIGLFLEDAREDHKTDPATLWFVAQTNSNRLLKVVFIYRDGNVHIKSAFDPNAKEIKLYDEFGR
jgi:uncharacterized DUF497 family protein